MGIQTHLYLVPPTTIYLQNRPSVSIVYIRKHQTAINNLIETKHTILNILSCNIEGFRETIDGVKINKLKDQQFIHKWVEYDFVFCKRLI